MRAGLPLIFVVLTAGCPGATERPTDADGGLDGSVDAARVRLDAGSDAALVQLDASSDARVQHDARSDADRDAFATDAGLHCPSAGECTLSGGAAGRCCADACVDLASDAANCGLCGGTCATGMRCRNGRCEFASCAPPAIADADCALADGSTGLCCGGVCHASNDFRSDTSSCGRCAELCPAGQICDTFQCLHVSPLGPSCGPAAADSCPVGTACYQGNGCLPSSCVSGADGSPCVSADGHELICCGHACVDPRHDASHCGACGNACGASAECIEGHCFPIDPSVCARPGALYGQGCLLASGTLGQCCGTSCVDVQSDDANCTRCGDVCPVGAHCSRFGCVASLPDGGMAGVRCSSDPQCPTGTYCDLVFLYCARQDCTAVADGSSCIAPGPVRGMCCSGACVNPRRDPNCGACGAACASGVCSLVSMTGGGPVITCMPDASSTADCAGAGGCPNGDPCVGGVCLSRTCTSGGDLCATASNGAGQCCDTPSGGLGCVDVTSDASNCGDCYTRCASGQSCVHGHCR